MFSISEDFGCVQVVQLTVTEGKDLPNISKAITEVANTLRDHGKSVIYLDLFRWDPEAFNGTDPVRLHKQIAMSVTSLLLVKILDRSVYSARLSNA